MSYLSGLLVAFLAIFYASTHLGQGIDQFFDPVAVAAVLGGTIAVFLMIFPRDHFKDLRGNIRGVLRQAKKFDIKVKRNILLFSENPANLKTVVKALRLSLVGKILSEGTELVGLGIEIERIEFILKTRVQQALLRRKRAADAIRSLAKYPPAFGLLGTVLGLVSMMREISTGSGSGEAGLKMSIALVATLYGILVANLILNPLAEAMTSFIARERARCDFAIQAIKLYHEGTTQIESQEILQSYLTTEDSKVAS
jgi:chemotaxis protein MotA